MRTPGIQPSAAPTREGAAAPDISVVVPLYDEAGNAAPLWDELRTALGDRRFEVVFVDDGSTESTWREIAALANANAPVKAVQLARNYGQSAALAAGLVEARAPVVVTIDGDGQNDPRDIPALLDRLDEGCEVVTGWRKQRRGALLTRRWPSRIANWLISRVMGGRLHDHGCGLKAIRRELFDDIHLYGEGHRILLAQAIHLGATIAEVPVNDRPRRHGRSKYGLGRTWRVLLDLLALRFLASYAVKPIHVFGGFGFAFILAAIGMALGLFVWRLLGGGFIIETPLTLLAAVLLIVGIQLVLLGLLAELLVRLYQQTGGTPLYRVRRRAGDRDEGA